MSKMLRPGVAVDEDVIEENQDETMEEGVEYLVHQSLERSRCVGQAESHDQELVEAFMGAECRLVHIVEVHPHLVVAGTEVQLGEEMSAAKLVQEFIHHRNGKLILHHLFVQRTIIHAEAPRVINYPIMTILLQVKLLLNLNLNYIVIINIKVNQYKILNYYFIFNIYLYCCLYKNNIHDMVTIYK